MSSARDYSTTASSNTTINSMPVSDSTVPNTLDNIIREQMRDVAVLVDDIANPTATTGSANAYVLTTAGPIGALADNISIAIRANHTNTGAATINVDGLGATAVQVYGQALTQGQIISGACYLLLYSATDSAFQVLNPSIGGSGSYRILSESDDLVIEVPAGQTLRLKEAGGGHLARFYAGSGFDLSFNNSTVFSGDVSGVRVTGDLALVERADHASTPVAGRGYLWVKDDSPCVLKFTDDAGTDVDIATSASVASQTGFSGSFSATSLSYTNGGLITQAHGLSAAPDTIHVTAVCVTAEGVFSIGDKVRVPSMWNSGSNYYGAVAWSDDTNIYVRIGQHGLRGFTAAGVLDTVWTPANWTISLQGKI